MKHTLLLVIALCTFAACTRPRHAKLPNAELLALAPNVSAGRLPNGLQYVVITDDNKQMALGIEAGRIHEEDGHSGVASMVPRVLVASVAPETPDKPEPWIRAHGDFTEILEAIRDPNRDLARMRSWIGAEMSAQAFAAEDHTASEHMSGDDLVRFSGTRLMRHPWWGTKADAPNLDIAALRRFRERWYVPNRMTLVISGPWKRDEVVAAIDRLFSSLPSRPTPPEPTLIAGPRGIVVAAECCYLRVSFLRDNPPPRSRADVRARMIRKLFERALVARLRNATNTWGANANDVSTNEWRLTRRVVSFELQLVTGVSKDIAAALIARELERVRLYGVTADELRRARQPARSETPGVATYSYIAEEDDCSRPVQRTIRGFLPISCAEEEKLERALMPTISDAEIDASRSSIDPRNAAFGAIDNEHSTATTGDIKLAIDRALAQPVPRWTTPPPLMTTRPAPGRIVRENHFADGIDLWLQNGAHVVFRPSRGERVTLNASSPGGVLAAADADLPAMENVARMVSVAGLGVHDGITTQRILAAAGVELSTEIELRDEHIRGSAPPRAVEELFQAVHLAMSSDRVDVYSAAVAYEQTWDLDERLRTNIPPRLATDLGVGDSVAPSPAHALALYRSRFGNAGDFTFEVSGQLELARVKELAATYLGSLRDDGRREHVAPLEVLTKRTELAETIAPKYSCSLRIYWTTPIKPTPGPPDEARLWTTLVGELVGDSVHALATRRGDLGYALELQMFYDCADPQQIDEATVRDRLARLANHRFTTEDVERVREAYQFGAAQAGPHVVPEAKAITLADIMRVLATFQPPAEVLVVRQVH